jgi:hypothetical protein
VLLTVLVAMLLVRLLGRLNLLRLLGLPVASLFVDMNFLVVLGRLRTAKTLLLSDVDLLLDVSVAVGRFLGMWVWVRLRLADGGCEGFVCLFVTFPSVYCLLRDLCFAFYLDTGRFLNFRVPIRRREDTEGDRNLFAVSARSWVTTALGRDGLVLQNPVCRSRVARS